MRKKIVVDDLPVFDPADFLEDEEAIAIFLAHLVEENDGALLLAGLCDIARARARARYAAPAEVNDTMAWDVIEVEPIAPIALRVVFADGTTGRVQFLESHLTHAFSPLKDPEKFRLVRIDGGAIAWPGGLDLAPDAMYQAIKRDGIWTLK